MKVQLTVVPPGGGEADYSFYATLPTIPRVGEYIILSIDKEPPGAFRVLYITYYIATEHQPDGAHTDAHTTEVNLQIEPIKHPYTTEGGAKRLLDSYSGPRWAAKLQEYPESGY